MNFSAPKNRLFAACGLAFAVLFASGATPVSGVASCPELLRAVNAFGVGPEVKPWGDAELDAFFSGTPEYRRGRMTALGFPVGVGEGHLTVDWAAAETSPNFLARLLSRVRSRVKAATSGQVELDFRFELTDEKTRPYGSYVSETKRITISKEGLKLYLETGEIGDVIPHELRHFLLSELPAIDPNYRIAYTGRAGDAIPVNGYGEYLSLQERYTTRKSVYANARGPLNRADRILANVSEGLTEEAWTAIRRELASAEDSFGDISRIRQIDDVLKATDEAGARFGHLAGILENPGEITLRVRSHGEYYTARLPCERCAPIDYAKLYSRFDREFPEGVAGSADLGKIRGEFFELILREVRANRLPEISKLPNANEIIRRGRRIRSDIIAAIREEIRGRIATILADSEAIKRMKGEAAVLQRELTATLSDKSTAVRPREVRILVARMRDLFGRFSRLP